MHRAVTRLTKEYKDLENNPHIFVSPDEDNVLHCQTMIIGPEDTPFEHCFLIFDVTFPSDYPISPPKVLFTTPDSKCCRMHPNLYAEGKVCLSILGTWGSTLTWSPLLTLEKVMLSVQALLDSNPLAHEPGQENKSSDIYCAIARWRALRAGVVNTMKRKTPFDTKIREYFQKNKFKYVQSLGKLMLFDRKTISCFHGTETIDVKAMENEINKL